ncbi:hypothetical protein RQP46_001090 [Phenoliferia psychrophenolica]
MPPPPSDPKIEGSLPTHAPSDALDATKVDANAVAAAWLATFGTACEQNNVSGIIDLIWSEGVWRDLLPLTWSYRSLGGKDGGNDRIKKVLDERLAQSKFTKFELDMSCPPSVENPFPDVSFVMLMYKFECKAGPGSGFARLIPKQGGGWEAFTISTVLEGLHGVEELTGPNRVNAKHTDARSWDEVREEELAYKNRSPDVFIIGAGQSGLDMAARLKFIGVDTLCVDRHARVGDVWRKRYASLRLHDPVWYDHMPYIPFPASWPVYTPAGKLADWHESYAHSLELNIWNSTEVISTVFDDKAKIWTVVVDHNGERRTLKPTFVVWAAGIGGGSVIMPDIPGMDQFEAGKIVHSAQFTSGKDWQGKKVVVVGACTSAHDICKDLVDQGAGSTTMVQRSPTYIMSVEKGMPMMMAPLYVEGGPPVDLADRIGASFSNITMKEIHKRVASAIKDADKELLDGLHAKGFMTTQGEDGSGFLLLAWSRAGGYYLDCGASQLIIDGKIQMKSGQGIKKFTKDKIVFEDDSTLDADLVIFATGYGDNREALRKCMGDKVADKLTPLWGLNYEREIKGCWTSCGHDNLYVFAGNLALCRFNSKLVALSIKAQLDGKFAGNADRCSL